MELIFGKYGKFEKKNPRETVPEVVTGKGPTPVPGGHAPYPHEPTVRRLMPFFGRKKATFW